MYYICNLLHPNMFIFEELIQPLNLREYTMDLNKKTFPWHFDNENNKYQRERKYECSRGLRTMMSNQGLG